MSLAYDHRIPGRCPVCGSHGVVSRQVGTLIAPNVHTYETRDVPCPHCTSGIGTRTYVSED